MSQSYSEKTLTCRDLTIFDVSAPNREKKPKPCTSFWIQMVLKNGQNRTKQNNKQKHL